MTTPNGPGPPHSPAAAEWMALHEALGGYLIALLIRAFEVPEPEAEWLVRERFTEYSLDQPATDERAWIIGAVCRDANDYRRRRGLPAADEEKVGRHAAAVLSYRDARERLPSRAREALRLRFEEKKSYAEIAEELGLSVHAAERFVGKAFFRLRELLGGRQTPEP